MQAYITSSRTFFPNSQMKAQSSITFSHMASMMLASKCHWFLVPRTTRHARTLSWHVKHSGRSSFVNWWLSTVKFLALKVRGIMADISAFDSGRMHHHWHNQALNHAKAPNLSSCFEQDRAFHWRKSLVMSLSRALNFLNALHFKALPYAWYSGLGNPQEPWYRA